MTEPTDRPSNGDALSAAAVELLRAIADRVEVARRLEIGAGEAVLRSVVDATVAIFQAEAASIALHDLATDRLVFRVAAGAQGQGVIGLAVPPEQGLAGYVFSTGQALAIADVAGDTRFGRTYAEETDYLPRTIIAVPLQDADGTLGVLEVLDKRDGTPFTIGDVELATVFATQATVAIRASRVERDTRELLASALRSLAEDGDESLAEEIAERATAELVEDSDNLWALAEQVARLRTADPSSVRLASEILAVVAHQAERERSSGDRFRR